MGKLKEEDLSFAILHYPNGSELSGKVHILQKVGVFKKYYINAITKERIACEAKEVTDDRPFITCFTEKNDQLLHDVAEKHGLNMFNLLQMYNLINFGKECAKNEK